MFEFFSDHEIEPSKVAMLIPLVWKQIGVEYFLIAFFWLKLIKQVIELRKARTENLLFGTGLQELVVDGWSVP